MLGRLGEAEASHRRALALDPDYAIARCNLGNALGGLHRQDEAEACYRRAVALDPHYDDAWDNLLLQLLYAPQSDAARLYAEHRAWGADFEAGLPPAQPHANPPDAERRLKVGYLSADFRTHSCAYFTEPLFAAHDRKRVEVFAYAQLRRADHVTARFQALADHWAEVAALDDAALARLIREDGIDVLVDLGGHTRDNRLRVLARRPAPVQVSWLGYPATTGLEAVEYRLTDALADPPGAADGTHAEELVRLEGGFLCYRPPADAPPVSPPPLDETGAVTFASFNNIAKVSEPALDAWAAILAAIPDARLVVKGSALDQPPVRRRIQADFETRGIAAERVGLKGWIARAEAPLALYHEADIALDSLPYNGTTTSCEALWMGLPVISLAGTHHAARVGASLLAQVGLGELMAESEADYVRIAVELARAPARIRAYRKELRARLRASPLMDEAGFARRVEAAYATLWRRWCASQNQG
jgi:predicted O-linked N-acetylglucosamine transferase (SPINDLY family)